MRIETNIVFPVAGAGSRFQKQGYAIPKPLMKISGHYFFEIAARALTVWSKNHTLSFIVLKQHCVLFDIDKEIKSIFPAAKIAVIDDFTHGAAETSFLGLRLLDLDNDSLVIADCDQWIKGQQINAMFKALSDGSADITLPTFSSNNPGYAYIREDNKGSILQIFEKEPATNRAVAGCYGFRSKELFNKLYLNQSHWGCERYLSSMVSQGIEDNYMVKNFRLDHHVSFGTPKEYEDAIHDSVLMGEISEW